VLGYVIFRILRAAVVVAGILVVVFFVSRLTGDPATMIFGLNATEDQIQAYRTRMGWDRPLHAQFGQFAWSAVRGDFGDSFFYTRNALRLVASRLPATLELAGAAIAFAVTLGLTAGVVAATFRGRLWDSATMSAAILGRSVPVFWLALLLIQVFAVLLGILPVSGRDVPASLVLPAVSLGLVNAAEIARLTRSSMVEVLAQDYVRTGHAKGLTAWRVVGLHALRNALVPVITIVGLQLGSLLGGAVITETIFAWPGLGQLTVQAILRRDFPVLQASVFLVALGFVAINLLLDLLYPLLDPRIARRG
jgi:peptide/nickel transport system permease protein